MCTLMEMPCISCSFLQLLLFVFKSCGSLTSPLFDAYFMMFVNLTQLQQPRAWTSKTPLSVIFLPVTTLKNENWKQRERSSSLCLALLLPPTQPYIANGFDLQPCGDLSPNKVLFEQKCRKSITNKWTIKSIKGLFKQRSLHTPFALEFCFAMTCVTNLSLLFFTLRAC